MQAAPPCVIPAANTCAQIFPQREVCEDQSGVWYGPGSDADPAQLLLDRAGLNLLADKTPAELTAAQQASFNQLSHDLTALLNSQSECPGDGNGDWRVDDDDLAEWAYWADPARGGGLSSWYDLNHDGLTNEADREIILAHSGSLCQP